jgi:nicotinate-nucleotide adenylyltransferase
VAPNLGLHLQRGMKVGLYGGSFDPAHEGHLHAAQTAMASLGLDKVVWLVSPGNPLKQRPGGGLAGRMAGVRALLHPRMVASDAESRLGLRYTAQTVRAFRRRYPGVRFVWIMGADSLAGFHRWRGWAGIFRTIPIAVVPRPTDRARARFAPAPRRFAHARLPSRAGRRLAFAAPPAWIDLPAPLDVRSSSAIRAAALVASRPPC